MGRGQEDRTGQGKQRENDMKRMETKEKGWGSSRIRMRRGEEKVRKEWRRMGRDREK